MADRSYLSEGKRKYSPASVQSTPKKQMRGNPTFGETFLEGQESSTCRLSLVFQETKETRMSEEGVAAVDLNASCDLFESDDDFEDYMSSLPDSVMDGSQPLPGERQFNGCELPEHVLESVFACLPIVDMMRSCPLVCERWKTIIQKKQFMRWKKLYHKVRRNSDESMKEVIQLLGSVAIEITAMKSRRVAPFVMSNLMKFMYQSGLDSLSDIEMKALKSSVPRHQHYKFALDLVCTRILLQNDRKVEEDVLLRTVCGAILFLCYNTSDIQSLQRLMMEALPHHVVMDFLYAAATALWVLYHYRYLSQEHHYRVICAIALVENASTPLPVSSSDGSDRALLFPLTHEQLRVRSHGFEPGQLVRVIAYAGAGKTSTLISCVKARPKTRFLYTSFSKAVVDAGKDVFTKQWNVTCSTLHSLAYRGMQMMQHRDKLNRGALRARDIREKLRLLDSETSTAVLVGKTLSNFMASDDMSMQLNQVPIKQKAKNKFGMWTVEDVTIEERRRVRNLAELFWRNTSNLDEKGWPMTDDCYLKMWQMTLPKITGFDVILLDEAQDCSECMRDILVRQRPHTALVFVGDSHQQIYGFRKAKDALLNVRHSHTYYLTQSFRFGGQIAQVADCILRAFKFQGFVDPRLKSISAPKDVADKTLFGVGKRGTVCGRVIGKQHAFLCRTNLKVITQTLKILADPKMTGKTIVVVGGAEKLGLGIIQDLFALTKTPSVRKTMGLVITRKYLRRFSSWKECYEEANRTDDNELLNKLEIVKVLGDKVPEAITKLRALPNNIENADIVVSTIHKAKGLEFDTVTVCDDFSNQLLQSLDNAVAMTNFIIEEANLLYVAATRAKRSLIMPSVLCQLLTKSHVRFLRLAPTTRVIDDESIKTAVTCATCKKLLTSKPFATFIQPAIRSLQESGPICQSCGERFAPGWNRVLGDEEPRVRSDEERNLYLDSSDEWSWSDDSLWSEDSLGSSDEDMLLYVPQIRRFLW